MKRIYEARYKTEFLTTTNNQEWYNWFFNRIFDYEHGYGKDLYDFNKKEIMEFLQEQKLSYSTLSVNKSYISTYIDWAIKKGLKINKNNAAREITTEDLRSISVETEIIHVDKIYDIIEFQGASSITPLKNNQDRLLIYLLFLGVRGNRAKELIDLKWEHVDFDNKVLKLSEITPGREDLRMDDFLIELLKDTRNEMHYDRYMDDSNPLTRNDKEDYELIETEYVFRKSNLGKGSRGGKMTYQGILARLISISKYVGENLTMTRIERSGMAYIGKKIKDQGMEITTKNPYVIGSIFKRYNITDDYAKGKIVRRIRKDIETMYTEES